MKGLIKFAAGAIAGAAVALLLTPETREQIREKIKDLADEAKKRAHDYCEQAQKNMAAEDPQSGQHQSEKEA